MLTFESSRSKKPKMPKSRNSKKSKNFEGKNIGIKKNIRYTTGYWKHNYYKSPQIWKFLSNLNKKSYQKSLEEFLKIAKDNNLYNKYGFKAKTVFEEYIENNYIIDHGILYIKESEWLKYERKYKLKKELNQKLINKNQDLIIDYKHIRRVPQGTILKSNSILYLGELYAEINNKIIKTKVYHLEDFDLYFKEDWSNHPHYFLYKKQLLYQDLFLPVNIGIKSQDFIDNYISEYSEYKNCNYIRITEEKIGNLGIGKLNPVIYKNQL